jgi:membrane fusion protein (multidrug efflux system)
MNNKLKNLNLFLSLFLFFMLTGCGEKTGKEEEVTVPVKVYKVQPESITHYLKLTGTITAGNDQVLYSKISERIEELYIKPGDHVNAGQLIAKQYNALLSQGVEAANANVVNMEAQYELSQQNYSRIERLYNQRAVSTQQFEQVSMQLKAAASALDAARAQLKQAAEQLDNSIVKAPFSGIVAAVYVELNQMVPAGQQVAQVIDPSTMKSKIRVASRDISLVRKGKEVVVNIPSIPGKVYRGKIVSIDQAVDALSKTLEIEVVLTYSDNNIKSGMYAEFMIPAASVEKAIVVPETSLLSQTEVRINKQTGTQETLKKYFLFTVVDQRAKMKEVRVGLISNARAEITNGINFNDRIIVIGNNIVQENQKVNIID